MSFWRPEILAAPNIPKPLHTVNPRTINGRHWWDIVRREAYAKNDFCCWACGVPKQHAEYHQWLEAHENYDFNWKTGEVKLKEIVGLCHSCHNFIHNGRLLGIYRQGEVGSDRVLDILRHGFGVCERNNIQPYFGAYVTLYIMMGQEEKKAVENAKKMGWYPKNIEAKWEDWHLVIDDMKYYSPFKDEEAWQNHWK